MQFEIVNRVLRRAEGMRRTNAVLTKNVIMTVGIYLMVVNCNVSS